MIELNGKYNTAKVFTDNIDSSTIGQVVSLLNQPFIEGLRVRIMPDCHAGVGCVVGTTIALRNKVVPYLVGTDIGCGMLVIKVKEKRIDLPAFDGAVKKALASSEKASYVKSIPLTADVEGLQCYGKAKINLNKVYQSLGTLGNGNHFIELDKDTDGNIYLVIHSGSRCLGKDVAEYYQNLAYRKIKESDCGYIPFEMSYLEGYDFDDYLHDMQIVQQFAADNRSEIARLILKYSKLSEVERFETVHNYIDVEEKILRKGSVSAKEGELLIIPINMRDGSLICEGKGNIDWNYSAPHGAGRLMSRGDAKRSFTVSEYKKTMKEAGVYTTSVGAGTLDECPMAYKSIESIVDNIEDTVEITKIITPIYNYKSSSID